MGEDQRGKYFQQITRNRIIPKNEFEHGAMCIDTKQEEIDVKTESSDRLPEISELTDQAIQLSNVGDDHLLQIYQNKLVLLTHLRDMARREEGIRPFFKVLYNGFRNSMIMTKARDGAERKYQGSVGRYMGPRDTQSYGQDMNYGQKDEGGSIIDKVMNRFNKNGNQQR